MKFQDVNKTTIAPGCIWAYYYILSSAGQNRVIIKSVNDNDDIHLLYTDKLSALKDVQRLDKQFLSKEEYEQNYFTPNY